MEVGVLLEAVVVSAIEEGAAVVEADEVEASVLEEEVGEDGEAILTLRGQVDSGVEVVE